MTPADERTLECNLLFVVSCRSVQEQEEKGGGKATVDAGETTSNRAQSVANMRRVLFLGAWSGSVPGPGSERGKTGRILVMQMKRGVK